VEALPEPAGGAGAKENNPSTSTSFFEGEHPFFFVAEHSNFFCSGTENFLLLNQYRFTKTSIN